MRKKQVLTVVSIAVVSFLIGTLFNMNFTRAPIGERKSALSNFLIR